MRPRFLLGQGSYGRVILHDGLAYKTFFEKQDLLEEIIKVQILHRDYPVRFFVPTRVVNNPFLGGGLSIQMPVYAHFSLKRRYCPKLLLSTLLNACVFLRDRLAVYYLDMKTTNLLISHDGRVVLADAGSLHSCKFFPMYYTATFHTPVMRRLLIRNDKDLSAEAKSKVDVETCVVSQIYLLVASVMFLTRHHERARKSFADEFSILNPNRCTFYASNFTVQTICAFLLKFAPFARTPLFEGMNFNESIDQVNQTMTRVRYSFEV